MNKIWPLFLSPSTSLEIYICINMHILVDTKAFLRASFESDQKKKKKRKEKKKKKKKMKYGWRKRLIRRSASGTGDKAGPFRSSTIWPAHGCVCRVYTGVVSSRISRNGWKFHATAALRGTKSRSRVTSRVRLKGGVRAYNRVRVPHQATRCTLCFPVSHLRHAVTWMLRFRLENAE